jgi:hypothetical protein
MPLTPPLPIAVALALDAILMVRPTSIRNLLIGLLWVGAHIAAEISRVLRHAQEAFVSITLYLVERVEHLRGEEL